MRIGALTFLTGHSASYGTQGARGIKLAVDQVNANGGVLGRPLFVDLQDTASDSAQAVSLLRRFAASSDVVAAIGPTGTPDLLAILPVAPQLTLPVMSYASQKTLTRDQFPDRVFRMSLVETPEVLRDFVSKVATARGIHRMGVFVDRANDSSPAEMHSLEAAIKLGANGVELVDSESYTSGDKDFSVQIGKMLRTGVDAIFLSGTTNEDVIIIPQARARGFRGAFLGGATLQDPKIVQIVGPAAAPYIVFTPFNANADRPVREGVRRCVPQGLWQRPDRRLCRLRLRRGHARERRGRPRGIHRPDESGAGHRLDARLPRRHRRLFLLPARETTRRRSPTSWSSCPMGRLPR